MKTFAPAPCFFVEKEILTILRDRGWFIGNFSKEEEFSFGSRVNFGPPLKWVTLSVSEAEDPPPFDQAIPFYAVWQLGISDMIAKATVETVNTEVFLVCHRPIELHGTRYVVGFDRRPFELVSKYGEKTEFPLGRIDLWDLDSLENSSFPRWKGIKFRFVIIAP